MESLRSSHPHPQVLHLILIVYDEVEKGEVSTMDEVSTLDEVNTMDEVSTLDKLGTIDEGSTLGEVGTMDEVSSGELNPRKSELNELISLDKISATCSLQQVKILPLINCPYLRRRGETFGIIE